MIELLCVSRQGKAHDMNGVLRVQAGRFAQNGAEFLDQVAATDHEIVPVRWHNVVNLKILNIAVPTRCVLAQLGQASDHNLLHYEPMALALGMAPYPSRDWTAEVYQRGFSVVPDDLAMEGYHSLTLAWKCLILQRRAADHPVHVRMSLAS